METKLLVIVQFVVGDDRPGVTAFYTKHQKPNIRMSPWSPNKRPIAVIQHLILAIISRSLVNSPFK